MVSKNATLPLVSVIVINYNGADHIEECLSALCADKQEVSKEILVVDNASTDDSLSIIDSIAENNLDIKLLKSSTNRGYTGGVNFALEHSKGKYVAVLNMDTIVTKLWLVEPIKFLEANPNAGAVSPLLVLADDRSRVNAAGQNVHITGLGFNRFLGRKISFVSDDPFPVSGIHGAAFIVRKSLLEQMQGLDEMSFLYHEDVDISFLLLLMGYDLYCIPGSIVFHKYFLTMSPEKLYLLERNRLAMLISHFEPFELLLIFPWIIFTEIIMWLYCLIRGRYFFQAKLYSYRWVAKKQNHLKTRRELVRMLRKRSFVEMLKILRWNYDWDQFITLGKERIQPQRTQRGNLPFDIREL